jgi:hypothetical protein
MDEQTRLDNELADITNNLLEKRIKAASASAIVRPLEEMIHTLDEIIQPDVPPSASFRARLTQRVLEEWNLLHDQRAIRRFNPRPTQLVALAASVAIVLTVATLLVRQSTSSELAGTATGSENTLTVLIVAGVVGVAAFFIWRRYQ